MKFVIEKGIPMPRPRAHGVSKYPFGELSVGDSFFVASGDDIKCQRSVSASAQNYGKRHQKKFATRVIKGQGVRVWRIE